MEKSICLDIRPFPQPQPVRNDGGDCFACALTAVLQHLFPDNPPSFDTVFEFFTDKYANSDKTFTHNTWPGYGGAVLQAYAAGYDVTCVVDFIEPKWKPERYSHAWWRLYPVEGWADRLYHHLNEGWVVVTEIDMDGRGPVRPDGKHNEVNHVIVLDGLRSEFRDIPGVDYGRVLKHSAHVVCSARGAYWIDCDDLLCKYGAAGLWLIRRNSNNGKVTPI